MTILHHFPDDTDPRRVIIHRGFPVIQTLLAGIDVRLERWPVDVEVDSRTSGSIVEILYGELIEKTKQERRFLTHDVIAVDDEHPAKEELRAMFLEEHTHREDEARFFLDGSGLFTFHAGVGVFALTAERNDFVNVPAGLKHWFDMGPVPRFTAIRFFNNEEGWIPYFTGDPISERFPRLG